uniref:Uncharacterized protein n=1 Tax=Vitrella brassicaformis TaxID=1169539 RepID=A0A7S1JQG4_9ALVE
MDSSSRTQRRYMLAAELPILRPSNSSHDAGTSLRSQSLPAPAATGGPARAALAASPPKRTDSFPTARITPVPGTIYMRTQPGRIARVFLKRVRPNVATDDAKMVDKTRGEKQDEADAQRDDQGEEESPLRRNGGRQGSRTPPQAQQSQPQTPLQAEPRHVTTHKGRETVPEAARPQTDIFPTTSLQNALDELMAKEQEGNEGEKAILASHPPASSIEETHIALAADLEIQRFLSRSVQQPQGPPRSAPARQSEATQTDLPAKESPPTLPPSSSSDSSQAPLGVDLGRQSQFNLGDVKLRPDERPSPLRWALSDAGLQAAPITLPSPPEPPCCEPVPTFRPSAVSHVRTFPQPPSPPPADSVCGRRRASMGGILSSLERFRRQLDESSMEQLQDIRERLQTMKREGEAWLAVGNSQGGIDE